MLHNMRIKGKIDIHELLQKLKEGTKFLPQVKWVSPNGLQISVAASVLGAAGLLLAVKDGKMGNFITSGQAWLSDGSARSDKSWFVPGLQNLGNNCFLNVILQALASCLSFRRYLEMIFEEYGGESAEKLPLTSALLSMLEVLCMVQHKRSVVSPRPVMAGLECYIPNFDLTSQQDAEEVLLLLLSSLREEVWGCYIPKHSPLADVTSEFNFRIFTAKWGVKESEQQRWKRCFLGPFDGILGSILSCQSCSFQISLEFQLFHSLHLSPPVASGRIIMPGCSVEDCLKHFFVSERIENYFCNHCWHVGAVKYLSLIGQSETDIEMLQHCNKDDSCHCKNLPALRALPWSNTFSRCFKQLCMTHSPQILCIHLQRASVNIFGEPVKLQGHISFPLILNLSPFINSGVGENAQENKSWPNFPEKENCVGDSMKKITPPGSKIGKPITSTSRKHLYRLVAVVQHYGKVGHGHYTVYRRVRLETNDEDPVVLLEPTHAQWFSISDSEVFSVSEKDVLDAETDGMINELNRVQIEESYLSRFTEMNSIQSLDKNFPNQKRR